MSDTFLKTRRIFKRESETADTDLRKLVEEAVAILKGEQVRSDFVERAEKALRKGTL